MRSYDSPVPMQYMTVFNSGQKSTYSTQEKKAHQPLKQFLEEHNITRKQWQSLVNKRVCSLIKLHGRFYTCLFDCYEGIPIEQLLVRKRCLSRE